MKRYDAKNVYLLGGSAGIGLSAAKLFATRGANVLLLARGAGRLRLATDEVAGAKAAGSQRVEWQTLDVSKPDDVRATMAKAVVEFGRPDVLVNCAGRAYPRRFGDVTYEQFDETMKINLYGAWNTCAALVPVMCGRGGHIVNVSSIAGFVGVFGYTDYAASKFALIGFSEALRSEVKSHGIVVSVLCPPDTDTPGFEVENRTKPDETKAISASARVMHPDAVARAMVRGMEKGRFLIVPGVDGKLAHLAKRLAPGFVERLMDRKIRSVRKRSARGETS
jgi:3-dehydrosphinganine reductase